MLTSITIPDRTGESTREIKFAYVGSNDDGTLALEGVSYYDLTADPSGETPHTAFLYEDGTNLLVSARNFRRAHRLHGL
jgi:hypothetical protein